MNEWMNIQVNILAVCLHVGAVGGSLVFQLSPSLSSFSAVAWSSSSSVEVASLLGRMSGMQTESGWHDEARWQREKEKEKWPHTFSSEVWGYMSNDLTHRRATMWKTTGRRQEVETSTSLQVIQTKVKWISTFALTSALLSVITLLTNGLRPLKFPLDRAVRQVKRFSMIIVRRSRAETETRSGMSTPTDWGLDSNVLFPENQSGFPATRCQTAFEF